MARVNVVTISESTTVADTTVVTVPNGNNYGVLRSIQVGYDFNLIEGAITGAYVVGDGSATMNFIIDSNITESTSVAHTSFSGTRVLYAEPIEDIDAVRNFHAAPWACDSATITLTKTGGSAPASLKVRAVYEQ